MKNLYNYSGIPKESVDIADVKERRRVTLVPF